MLYIYYVNSVSDLSAMYFMKIIILKVAVSCVTISHFTYAQASAIPISSY